MDLKQIYKAQLFRILSLNGISVIVRIFGGLITSKAIAAYVGAGGMALVGNLRDFLISVEYFSTLGMQNGIIKYMAENEKDNNKLYSILSTVFITLFGASLIVGLLLLGLSSFFTQWIFGDQQQYEWIIKVLAFSVPWYAGSVTFMAILNGLGNYKKVIWLNIAGNVVGVTISVLLMWKFHIAGALLGLIFFQVLMFIFSFYAVWKKFPGLPFFKFDYFDVTILRNLLSYSVMTVVTVLLMPVVYQAIRNNLIKNYNPDTAGYWEAMNRLSSYYMMFAVTMVSVYFFPRLSAAQTTAETKKVFWNYYKSMLPIFGVGLVVLYILREYVVLIIFNEEFLPMTNLFFWQLLGDFFKVASLILGYQFFAKKLTRYFIISELVSFSILYSSSIFFIGKYGAEGAVMAHTTTYFILLITLIIFFRKNIF